MDLGPLSPSSFLLSGLKHGPSFGNLAYTGYVRIPNYCSDSLENARVMPTGEASV